MSDTLEQRLEVCLMALSFAEDALAAEKQRSERLEKALKEIAYFGIGELRPLADEIAIWRIAKTALGDSNG